MYIFTNKTDKTDKTNKTNIDDVMQGAQADVIRSVTSSTIRHFHFSIAQLNRYRDHSQAIEYLRYLYCST